MIPTGFLDFLAVELEEEEEEELEEVEEVEEEGEEIGMGVTTVVEVSFSMSARRLELERVGLRMEGSSVSSFSSLVFSLFGEEGLLNKSW